MRRAGGCKPTGTSADHRMSWSIARNTSSGERYSFTLDQISWLKSEGAAA